jgi:ribosomal protein L21E
MSIIQKIFSALNADEKQAVKTELAQAELKEGTMIEADSFEEGQAVFIITEDGEKIPMPEGTYELEDGRKVEVNDSSMIVAIGKGEDDKAEGEAEVEQEAKEEMEEEAKEEMAEEPKEEELKEDEKEEMTDMDKLKEELRKYVREVVMEAMQEKEEMSSEETAPEASAEEAVTEEKAEEVAVEASAQKVSAKIKVKPEGTRPDTIDWFKPQMRSSTMGNVFKHINK